MSEKMHGGYLSLTALVLVGLTVLGLALGYVYSLMATDIMYSNFAVYVMGVLVDVVSTVRVCVGYGAVLYAMWRWEWTTEQDRYRCGGTTAFVVWLLDAAEYFSSYLVDSATSSITDRETMAILWLLLQLLSSTALLLLCYFTGRRLCHPAGERKKATLNRAMTQCVAYILAARLLSEISYLADFLRTYSSITAGEITTIVGQFVYILLLYGGAAWLSSMATLWCFRKGFGKA